MNRDVLERPFDKALVKSRQGSFGRELSYVEARHYIERLNEAFDGAWSFEVTYHEVLPLEVLVLGKLSASGHTKQAFGGSQITKNRQTGEVLSIADDLKAAATDALKKAASLFGVGLHLYGEDGESVSPPTSGNGNGRHEPTQRSYPPQPPHHLQSEAPPSDGNGNGNARLTARQLAAVWAIARQNDIPQREVRRLCVTDYGRQPEFLSKGEASQLIDQLKNFPLPQGQG